MRKSENLECGSGNAEVESGNAEVGSGNAEVGSGNVWAKGIEHSVMRKDSLPMIRFSAANR
jgi:hypothetical protein